MEDVEHINVDLAKWLIYKFESGVYVHVTPNASDSSTWKSTLESSVSIDDEAGLMKLFPRSYDKTEIQREYIEDIGLIKFTIPELEDFLDKRSLKPAAEYKQEIFPSSRGRGVRRRFFERADAKPDSETVGDSNKERKVATPHAARM